MPHAAECCLQGTPPPSASAAGPLQGEVLSKLRKVIDPDFGMDIVACGFVKDVVIDGGKVAFTLELTTPACPVKEVFQAQATQAVKVGALPIGVRSSSHADPHPNPPPRTTCHMTTSHAPPERSSCPSCCIGAELGEGREH